MTVNYNILFTYNNINFKKYNIKTYSKTCRNKKESKNDLFKIKDNIIKETKKELRQINKIKPTIKYTINTKITNNLNINSTENNLSSNSDDSTSSLKKHLSQFINKLKFNKDQIKLLDKSKTIKNNKIILSSLPRKLKKYFIN